MREHDNEEIIRKAMKYPIDQVMFRYRQDTGLSEKEAKRHERELKRFLALSAASERGYGMRGPIDNLWHTFILFTHLYENFCRDVAGPFIHHFPNIRNYDGPSDPPLDLGNADYIRFLKDYEATFGERPESPYWPEAPLPGAGSLRSNARATIAAIRVERTPVATADDLALTRYPQRCLQSRRHDRPRPTRVAGFNSQRSSMVLASRTPYARNRVTGSTARCSFQSFAD